MALPPLWPVATALLDLVVATFTAEGVDLPSRRYITAGSAQGIAWDCEQLVIGLVQMSSMPAGTPAGGEYPVLTPAPTGVILPPSATFLVELVRDQPEPGNAAGRGGTPKPPSPAAEMAAAETSLTDAACLHRVAVRAMRDGLTSGDGQVSYAGVEPAGPQGGASAQRLRVTATLI